MGTWDTGLSQVMHSYSDCTYRVKRKPHFEGFVLGVLNISNTNGELGYYRAVLLKVTMYSQLLHIYEGQIDQGTFVYNQLSSGGTFFLKQQ